MPSDILCLRCRLLEVPATAMMHQNKSEVLVVKDRLLSTAAAECNQSASHRCVQPVIINARPVILVSDHEMMQRVAAAAPVVVIQHPLTKPHSTVTSQSQIKSCTQHRTKRRRRNKV